jgi:ElaB/YqjD/DUF883 family membrane-anchored ribosome-binding protein
MATTDYLAADDGLLSSDRGNRPLNDGGSPFASADQRNGAQPQRSDNDLFDRVVQGAHQAIDSLADSAAPHVQRLQQGMASASDTWQERADQARDMSGEWAETMRCAVRDNPLAAVGAALVAGVLIARLTQR